MTNYQLKTYKPVSKQPKIGIYVAKPGKSIDSPNRGDYTFIPDRPTVSIKKRLSLTVTTASIAPGTQIAEYKHGFGYIPQIIAFVTTEATRQGVFGFDPGRTYLNAPSLWQSGDDIIGGQHYEIFDAYADEQNVYVEATRYTLIPMVGVTYITGTYTFDILLLMEEAK